MPEESTEVLTKEERYWFEFLVSHRENLVLFPGQFHGKKSAFIGLSKDKDKALVPLAVLLTHENIEFCQDIDGNSAEVIPEKVRIELNMEGSPDEDSLEKT